MIVLWAKLVLKNISKYLNLCSKSSSGNYHKFMFNLLGIDYKNDLTKYVCWEVLDEINSAFNVKFMNKKNAKIKIKTC